MATASICFIPIHAFCSRMATVLNISEIRCALVALVIKALFQTMGSSQIHYLAKTHVTQLCNIYGQSLEARAQDTMCCPAGSTSVADSASFHF